MAKRNIEKPEKPEVKIQTPEGTFCTITVEDKHCFLKKPNKKTLGTVLPMLTPTDGKEPNFITIGEIVLRECFIGGDEEFLFDDDFVIAASLQAITLVTFKIATLKKN